MYTTILLGVLSHRLDGMQTQQDFPLHVYPGPKGFSWPITVCISELRGSHEAARKKNLWSLWTWISLSCSRQDQDLTLELGLAVFLQTRKLIWLVRFIGNTEGTVEIFVTALLVCTYLLIALPEKEFVSKYCSSQFISTFKIRLCSTLILFLTVPSKEFDPALYLRNVFQRLKVLTNIKVINRNDVFAILPTGHRKSVYYNSVDTWCRQIPGYSYPHRTCHNFGCVLWSFWWTLIFANWETVAFQRSRRRGLFPFRKQAMPGIFNGRCHNW